MEGNTSLILTFFYWWYGEAYAKLFVFLERFMVYLADMFSVRVCLRTLFAPWKRDQISTQGLSLQQRFQVLLMNMASRLVGAMVKVMTIIVFLIVAAVALAILTSILLLWLIWIPVVLFILYKGVASALGR